MSNLEIAVKLSQMIDNYKKLIAEAEELQAEIVGNLKVYPEETAYYIVWKYNESWTCPDLHILLLEQATRADAEAARVACGKDYYIAEVDEAVYKKINDIKTIKG